MDVPTDSNLLKTAEKYDTYMDHMCDGVYACSTCHVWIRHGLESLSEQEDREMDRLDQTFDMRVYSRLGCQSEYGDEDMKIELTEESLSAFMDKNPQLRHQLEAEGKWPLKK